MLIRVHEQLDGLPAYEAIWAETWNGWWFIWAFRGLQTVETTEGLVYEGERLGFGLKKERIVVTADFAIEGSEAVWREIGVWVGVERGLCLTVSLCLCNPSIRVTSHRVVACLTINCAIPRHSCSNSGAGLLSGLIRVPQWLVAEAMAGRGLARSEGPEAGADSE